MSATRAARSVASNLKWVEVDRFLAQLGFLWLEISVSSTDVQSLTIGQTKDVPIYRSHTRKYKLLRSIVPYDRVQLQLGVN